MAPPVLFESSELQWLRGCNASRSARGPRVAAGDDHVGRLLQPAGPRQQAVQHAVEVRAPAVAQPIHAALAPAGEAGAVAVSYEDCGTPRASAKAHCGEEPRVGRGVVVAAKPIPPLAGRGRGHVCAPIFQSQKDGFVVLLALSTPSQQYLANFHEASLSLASLTFYCR